MATQRMTRQAPRLITVATDVAGMDIGAREIWVAGPVVEGTSEVGSFGTTTSELRRMVSWLKDQNVRSVAMESTGVYWIPPAELLDAGGIEVVLVNPRQLRSVPGRKTDCLDCQWLQTLHSAGLLRGSFRPADAICEMRSLHRHISNLTAERSKFIQWMQKALTQMNVKVHHAVTDITGKTGIAIIKSIVDGERDPQKLAALRDHRCRQSAQVIAEHLTGTWMPVHVFELTRAFHLFQQMNAELQIAEDYLAELLRAIQPPEARDREVPEHPNASKQKQLVKKGEDVLRKELVRAAGVDLTRIDGISASTARLILCEVGLDLQAFPSEKHFTSWLGLAPKTRISGGKALPRKRNGGMGATRVGRALKQSAVSLNRADNALGAAYRRKARQKGKGVAVKSIARRLAILVYRALRWGIEYVDIGAAAENARLREQQLRSLRRGAKKLGLQLVPAQATA